MSTSLDETPDPIVVTREARSVLAGRLRGLEARLRFRRVDPTDGRPATVVTAPVPGDALFEHEGRVVLSAEATLADRLRGHTIDIDESGAGQGALIVV